MEGWIKIYPKMMEWRWYKDGYTVRIFLHLLLTAAYKDKPYLNTVIRRGQVLTSVKRLSEDLAIPEKTVRRKLENLKSTGELVTESTNKWTIITICNYDSYQEPEKTDDQTNDRANDQTDDQQLKNNRNIYPPSLSKERVSPLAGGTPIEERQRAFYDSLIPFVGQYGKSMIRAFYDYWTEPDRAIDSRKKMRFEKEKTWSLEKRLDRWKRVDDERAAKRPQQQQARPSKLDQYKEVARQLGIYQDGTEQSDNIDEQ